MKILPFLFALACLFGCQQQAPVQDDATQEDSKKDALTGAWKMNSILSVNKTSGDTLWYSDSRVQYKMYVDGSVMWEAESPKDSVEWYGYGTYSIKGDSLYEVMSSGSNSFRESNAEGGNSYTAHLSFTDDGYTQLQVWEDSILTYEHYTRVK